VAKVILALGAAAAMALGIFLSKSVEREEFPPSDGWAKVMNGSGEPGALQVVGAWEDRDAARHVLEMAPPAAWRFMREGDDFRIRIRTLAVPVVGMTLSQLQWEIRRGGETWHFGEPPAWRFWSLVGSIAAVPLVLSALVAVAVALASRKTAVNP